MTFPLIILLVIAAVYALKHKGSDGFGMALGVCIGVLGSSGLIGQVVHSILDVIVQVGGAVTSGINLG